VTGGFALVPVNTSSEKIFYKRVRCIETSFIINTAIFNENKNCPF